jgi:undecaprenyl-diphosphatase
VPFVIGVFGLIAASGMFVAVAVNVATGDPPTLVDLAVVQWFHAHTYPALTGGMVWVSDLHGVMAVSLYVSLLALYLFWKRDWVWLVFLVSAVPGGMLLNETMKHLFRRSRPILEHSLLTLPSYSFPSGHVAGATLFYGALAIMFISAVDDWRKRGFIICVALTMVTLVAVSRLYLGVHYLSDTLAAFTEACAWLSLCVLGGQRYLKL